jgi:hypothetical protein
VWWMLLIAAGGAVVLVLVVLGVALVLTRERGPRDGDG